MKKLSLFLLLVCASLCWAASPGSLLPAGLKSPFPASPDPTGSALSNGLSVDSNGYVLINAGGASGTYLTNGLKIDSSGNLLVNCATGCSGGGGGLSGMTAGQVPIAGTASTVTSSEALAGSGAGITTGPVSGVTSTDLVAFTGTLGQIADSGASFAAPGTIGSSTPNTGAFTTLTGTSVGCGVLNTTACILTGYGSTSGTATLTWPAAAGTPTNAILSSNNLSAPALVSTVSTGTAPLTITSTTQVANLNAATLGGNTISTPTAQWGIGYASTATNYASTAALTANALIKAGSAAAPSASSITDNGTIVSTSEAIATTSTLAAGASPPSCTFGTGGATCLGEGTAATAASAQDIFYADSTYHELMASQNNFANAASVTFFPVQINTINTQTASYAVVPQDSYVLCNKATAMTITLISTGISPGKTYHIKNIGAGTCTVSETGVSIDGGATGAGINLGLYQAATLVWDGTQYWQF